MDVWDDEILLEIPSERLNKFKWIKCAFSVSCCAKMCYVKHSTEMMRGRLSRILCLSLSLFLCFFEAKLLLLHQHHRPEQHQQHLQPVNERDDTGSKVSIYWQSDRKWWWLPLHLLLSGRDTTTNRRHLVNRRLQVRDHGRERRCSCPDFTRSTSLKSKGLLRINPSHHGWSLLWKSSSSGS